MELLMAQNMHAQNVGVESMRLFWGRRKRTRTMKKITEK
jgi:hypothetical protein